ncbi:MAG: aspartyl-phosphate phosphatase Spo0E family protein [Firmicutes bacterium]|nr:aspartyl-phosphate phosphatase Spo0E family protein [Bacillota bacterium]
MQKKDEHLEQKIEKVRALMKLAYKHGRQSLCDKDIYRISTRLDTLITDYMKSHYS